MTQDPIIRGMLEIRDAIDGSFSPANFVPGVRVAIATELNTLRDNESTNDYPRIRARFLTAGTEPGPLGFRTQRQDIERAIYTRDIVVLLKLVDLDRLNERDVALLRELQSAARIVSPDRKSTAEAA